MKPQPKNVELWITRSLGLSVEIFPMQFDATPDDVLRLCLPKAAPDFLGAAYDKCDGTSQFLFWDLAGRSFAIVGLGRKGTDYAYSCDVGRSFDGAWCARLSEDQAATWFEESNAAGRLDAEMHAAAFMMKELAPSRGGAR